MLQIPIATRQILDQHHALAMDAAARAVMPRKPVPAPSGLMPHLRSVETFRR